METPRPAPGNAAEPAGPGPWRASAFALALLLAAAGLAFADGAWFAAALPFAAWAALGLWQSPPRPVLSAERRLPAFAAAGVEVEVRLAIRNEGPRLDELLLEETLPAGATPASGEPRWMGSLEAGATAEFAYRAVFPRGVHRFGPLLASAGDPFAATRTRARIPCDSILVAEPRPLSPPDPLLAAAAARAFAGRSGARRRGCGTDFAGTREYAPGDPLRSLNWRAEALWGQGVVNVFEEERAVDVGVILDARSGAYDSLGLFESAVAAAAALARVLLEGGNRVAFLSYGATVEWTAPGLGREQGLKIRLAAARASLGDHSAFERFDNLPIGLFPPRSSILLVSPLLREDLKPLRSLAALGYAVTILRPDPLAAADDDAGAAGGARDAKRAGPEAAARRVLELEYATLRARLANAGMEVLDWRPDSPLRNLFPRAGRRR